MKITEYLKQHILITDGAMGTYYNKCYPLEGGLVEQAVLTDPKRIVRIHEEYIEAGAQLIRTNSFAVNDLFFSDANQRSLIAKKSFRLAMEAVEASGKDVYVAADFGTLFHPVMQDLEQLLSVVTSMVDAFYEVGARIFLFETQADTYGLDEIFTYIKEKDSENEIILTFSFDKNGYTKGGLSFERILQQYGTDPKVDVYGVNCGMDPSHIKDLMEQATFYSDKPWMVLPNAGYPYILRGQTLYRESADYFVSTMEKVLDLGANVVGGCCGSTPEYIRKMVERFGKRRPMPKDIGDIPTSMTMEGRTLSSFWKKLGTGEKAFVVELDPPFNEDISKVMQGAKLLKEAKVDLLTLSDSPLGRTRMDPMLLGAKIQKESGIFVMPHVACRDRNLISLRGMLLGSYVNDIRHFLMVTGDPVPAADRSHVTSVFDYNSIRFMNMAKMMNSDVFAKDTIVYGGALNYHGRNVEAIAKRMQLKMDQGCSYFLTQPVYSQEDIQRVAQLKEMTGANIIAGIMPLVSYKNAIFMTNEMPGIHIPDEIVSRYHPDMTREEAEDVAVSTSLDIARNIAGVCDGYYLMTPFNRVTLIVKIIDAIRDELA